MSTRRSRDDALAASLKCMAELARSRGAASVTELAAAAGISQRTFYRHFPRKEDCIRPALSDGQMMLTNAFVDQPATASIADAFLEAFRVAAGGAFTDRTAALIPAVVADPALSAVWDHELNEGDIPLARAIAVRLGLEPGDPRAVSSAAVLLTMVRLAFRQLADEGGDAVAHLESRLSTLSLLPLFADPSAHSFPAKSAGRR